MKTSQISWKELEHVKIVRGNNTRI